ncbi:endonuclease domain-containing protein [Sphingomonas sp.]|uniref:endonuclease domain-containing protein n=1 Tax=Sphingomonas sp. TaxID=28214 RepID=UPI003CC5EFD3
MLSPRDNDRRTEVSPGHGRGKGWNVTAERLAELHRRAAEVRRNPTEEEKRLWRALSGARMSGCKFRRQAVLPPFIADFFCPAVRLIVEVDGDTHDREKDRLRDDLLGAKGYHVLRVTNADVISNLEGVWRAIGSAIASPLPFRGGVGGGGFPRAIGLAESPHPNPSAEGEGLA